MAGPSSSRWADNEEDVEADRQRKLEKEAKKKAKAERARQLEDQQRRSQEAARNGSNTANSDDIDEGDHRAAKRQKLTPSNGLSSAAQQGLSEPKERQLLNFEAPQWFPCRSVENFERLNHIEEGSYGWVSRARETATGEVVALKKLKMQDMEMVGFPITGLREIQCLQESRHRHIVELREVVMGHGLDEVFLVMEFLEHDLKTLQEEMQEPFLPSEIKTLLLQLSSAVDYLHDNWILHRDLKTSNILMNNRGEIKIADFGMARHYSDPPPPNLTQLVVTLWYRAPELLLGADKYGRAIDMWSIGCIFGELLTKEPLLQGRNEVSQLTKVFELCGIPTEDKWPGFKRLPNAKSLRLPRSQQNVGSVIRAKFPMLTAAGTDLLSSLLSLNPARRPSAREVMSHPYFREDPRPKSTAMFPTFPSKAGQEKRRRIASPSAPKRGDAPKIAGEAADFSGIFASRDNEEAGAGFQLKLV
ncbi:MAG: hypothetical protein M1828_004327 [Chrysothrix sp. TS-e1954]|nr:MAG: hypothetical protein M1828_004327 [Chrysothrix sp. TS-e1954]